MGRHLPLGPVPSDSVRRDKQTVDNPAMGDIFRADRCPGAGCLGRAGLCRGRVSFVLPYPSARSGAPRTRVAVIRPTPEGFLGPHILAL